MGTALSVSPTTKKDSADGGAVYQSLLANQSREKKPLIKKGSLLLGTLSLKKLQTVVRRRDDSRNSSVKKESIAAYAKSSSCYTIAESSGEGVESGGARGSEGPVLSLLKKSETFPSSLSAGRRTIIQASTSELLFCVGKYLCDKCWKLRHLQVADVVSWLRAADRALISQGWQEIGFINPANVVFVYMLIRDVVTEDVDSVQELRSTVLTCLYMSYSYMGNEISYPIKPFLAGGDKDKFWDLCLKLIDQMSDKMLEINRDPLLFTSLFRELKSFSKAYSEE